VVLPFLFVTVIICSYPLELRHFSEAAPVMLGTCCGFKPPYLSCAYQSSVGFSTSGTN
jgi:hypothetical protein